MFKRENLLPKNFDELIGKEIIFNEDSIIKKMIISKKMISFLFFGPPGSGKSLSIKLILKKMGLNYYYFNSSSDKKKDLDEILEKANEDYKPIIIVEEIHRLNKDKQDLLLYYLEKELIYVMATTTENPYFVVNPAIRSRLMLYEIKRLDDDILVKELKEYLNKKNIQIDNKLIEYIVYSNFGDLRKIFFIIELVLTLYKGVNSEIIINELSKGNNGSNMDIKGNFHYDYLSAFHKSIRGSDPNAAIYYLACLLESGDLVSIFRRLYAIAHEDIGLANPDMGVKVHAAIEAARAIGLPEARIPLANITIELALSVKSNTSINAIDEALNLLKVKRYAPPKHICDNHYASCTKLGVNGYKFPHNYKYNWVKQQYLPNEIKNKQFYIYNKFSLYESKLDSYWKKIKERDND